LQTPELAVVLLSGWKSSQVQNNIKISSHPKEIERRECFNDKIDDEREV
jgi:hypothetical protein